MFEQKVREAMTNNNSLVCIGLDSDYDKLPGHLRSDPNAQFIFNKAIIDSTADLVCAYKPNSAFYEALGENGMRQLKQTADYLHDTYPDIPLIMDSKRADIGNTNNGYVHSIFDYMGMDAVTLHPYLGKEALEPFLSRSDKGSIILCRTSNPGSGEFQDLIVDGQPIYEHVAKAVSDSWNTNKNCMLVVGATYPEEMSQIRSIVGDMIFLVPGIGVQGGDLESVMKAGVDSLNQGMIISSSRGIIFASSGKDFAEAARMETISLRDEINKYRS